MSSIVQLANVLGLNAEDTIKEDIEAYAKYILIRYFSSPADYSGTLQFYSRFAP
jgi:hypothetical protein